MKDEKCAKIIIVSPQRNYLQIVTISYKEGKIQKFRIVR